jgi:hypothetical protein
MMKLNAFQRCPQFRLAPLHFALAAFITAPFAGIALQQKRCTRKQMMIFGMLLNAVFTATFGLLEFVDMGGDEEGDVGDEEKGKGVWVYLALAYGQGGAG